MAAAFEKIRLIGPPAADGEYVALDEHENVHLHDYPRIYAMPGLYEYIVQERLRCRSPQVAVDGFVRAITRLAMGPGSVTVLDFGAGTGLVGELLRGRGVTRVVGVDSLAEAARQVCVTGPVTTPTTSPAMSARRRYWRGCVNTLPEGWSRQGRSAVPMRHRRH